MALELRDNNLGDDCVEALADLVELGQLKELDLRGNPFATERGSCDLKPDLTLSLISTHRHEPPRGGSGAVGCS